MEKEFSISEERSALNSILLRLDGAYTIFGNLVHGKFASVDFEDMMHHRKIIKDMVADIESIKKNLP